MIPKLNADEQKNLLNWLKQQGGSVKRPSLFLSLLTILGFILQLALFWLLALAAQTIIVDSQTLSDRLFLGLASLMVLTLVCDRARLFLSEKVESTLYNCIQSRLFKQLSTRQYALIRQQPTYFWQQLGLVHLPAIVQFNVRYLMQQRLALLAPLFILLCTFSINWLVGLVLMLSLPVVPLFMIVIGNGVASLHRKHFKALTRLGSLFVDRLKALELLQIFSAHQRQSAVLSTASEGLNRRTMQVVGVAFLSASVLDFFATLAVALVAVFVGFNLLGEFTLGGQFNLHSGLFLLLAVPLCFAELKKLGNLYHLRAEAIAAAAELAPILKPREGTQQPLDARTFKHLDWPTFFVTTPAITAENIHLERGDWIRLEGASGSGKTCILESLLGQRQGSHVIQHSVLVSQHSVILPRSIRDNLCLYAHVTDNAIHAALNKVELTEWLVQQVNGLDTVLNEDIPLSGGQKQRLALARVLLRDAPLILLDEPTAHLSDAQHQRLSAMIKRLLAQKTVIWASHKPLPNDWFSQHWHIRNGHLNT